MYTLFTILIFVASILLVLIVLVQKSKGGGLASNFSATNQVMGVRKTTDFLEKATWTLTGAICLFSIVSAGFVKDAGIEKESVIKNEVEKAVAVDPNIASPKFNSEEAAAPAAQAPAAAATAAKPEAAPAAAPAEKK